MHVAKLCRHANLKQTCILYCFNIDDAPKLPQLYLLKPGDGCEVKIIDTVADQWSKLASALGFDMATCDSLATSKAPAIACKEMFTCWLKQNWQTI